MSSNKTSREARKVSATGGWRRPGDPWTISTSSATLRWNNTVVYSPNVVGWKEKIAAGTNVSTTLDGVRGTYRAGYGSGHAFAAIDGYTAYADGAISSQSRINPFSQSSAGLTSPLNEALTQAMIGFSKDFSNKTNRFQTGVFMGELGEAVRMLASPAKTIRQSIDNLYRKAFTVEGMHRRKLGRITRKDIRLYQDAIAGLWLEWKFGVDPFISDLDAAAEAFRAMASGRCFDIIRVKGQGRAVVAAESFLPFSPATAGWPASASYRHSVSIKKSVTVDIRGAWKNRNPSGEMPLPMTFGLGIKDIIPTAYELLPWSFFADYFSNLGDVLGAWSMRFVDLEWCNKTTRERHETFIRPPPVTYASGGYSWNVVMNPTHVSRWDVSRAPFTSGQWNPTLRLKVPGMGSTKWLNIAALMQMVRPPTF